LFNNHKWYKLKSNFDGTNIITIEVLKYIILLENYGGKTMAKVFLVNTILDRLPVALFGITHVNATFTGEVCPKLNIALKRSKLSLPCNEI